MNLNPLSPLPEDDEVVTFFRGLGYKIDWDFSGLHGSSWYEISDDEGLICQVDMGVPLSAIIADFTAYAAGKEEGTSDVDYAISGPDTPALQLLFKRVAKAKTS